MTQHNYLLIFCMGFILQVTPLQPLFISPSNTFAANNWFQQDELTASTRAQFDNFGYSTALSADGNVAIAGAKGYSSQKGAVYIFTRSGGIWAADGGAITATGGADNDFFGCSVATSSDAGTVVVGARGKNSGQGTAYVFTRSGSTLTDQAELTRGDGAAMDDFGVSVSLSADGNTAIVGAEGKNSAYIFIRSGSVWSQQGSPLTPSGASAGDHFGFSVSLSADGNTALIGAPGKDSGKGAAYIYTRSGATWSPKSVLTTSDALADNDSYGYSVAISADGNTALIGAANRNSSRGCAYVFVLSGDNWIQQGGALALQNGLVDDNFGLSVSMSGDGNTALIGAVGRSSITGAAYIFTRASSLWTEQAELTANNGVENDNFAFSTALSSDSSTAACGAIGTDTFSGSLYILQPLKPTVTTTNPITNISSTSATGGGNVTSDGGAAITSRGVCWSTSTDPTTSDSCTSDGSGTGLFTSDISNLLQATTYHVRAFATNIAGTAYGSDVAFSTNSILNVTLSGSGTGTGTVHSTTPDINCNGGTCSGSYPYGTPVTLTADPGLRSVFAGWQGSCSNPSGDCSVTMDSGRAVLATFNVDPAFAVWINPGDHYRDKISSAYLLATSSSATIKSCNIEITDELNFGQNKTIILSGGYKADFVTRSGYTVIKGKMTISSDVVTVENLVIR